MTSMADRARTNRNRRFGIGVVLALLMTGVILLPGASTTSAQGAFAGAILELIPDAGTSISQATAGTGTFIIQGTVFENRSVAADCSNHSDSIGRWTMWGVRLGGATGTTKAGDPLPANSISAGNAAVVNMSLTLKGFNGTLEFQGTLGRAFSAIDSAGHLTSDTLAVTGGTGTFRSASGDAIITPLVVNATITGTPPFPATATQCGAATDAAGGFQLFLREGNKSPTRFGNVLN